MQLDLSVPKKNAVSVADGEDGLLLCSAREGMERALSAAAGRALVLADGSSFSSFIPASRAANTVCMLWDGDALGLFALPEVRSVLVSGGRDAVEGARFFAAVRRIPCTVFAKDAAMDGIFSPRARVKVNGCCPDVPLAPAVAVADLSLAEGTYADAYARLLLSRLALFEARALGRICRRETDGAAWEEAFCLTDAIGTLSREQVVRRNARLRQLEAQGVPSGEGASLLARLGEKRYPAATAYLTLLALYTAFFRRGVPRRYAVPAYRRSGVYAALPLPTAGEYASRALRLERARGELCAEAIHLRAGKEAQLAAMRALDAHFDAAPALEKLNFVPECAPDGLCAVMRDFGLLEGS